MDDENSLIAQRREKLATLQARGANPFGHAYENSGTIAEVRKKFSEGATLRAAGRITAHRDMGKSHFVDLRDSTGRIQVYIHAKEVGGDVIEMFKLIDLGDFIGVEGTCFLTKTGEPTLKVRALEILGKSLRPLPEKWHGLQDVEARYRQRYLDLLTNEHSRAVFEKRIMIVREIRNFMEARGFLEVETPMLQAVAGGAAAEPFRTHHKALGLDLYLRIAPELYLKRLLVGGFNKVFELNRNFRNEGISRKHNPEFTMLEAYWAYADFEKMADLVEELICHVAQTLEGRASGETLEGRASARPGTREGEAPAEPPGEPEPGSAGASPSQESGTSGSSSLRIEHRDAEGNVTRTINLTRPWRRARYRDLIREIDPEWFNYTSGKRRERCTDLGVEINPRMADYEVTQQVFEKLIEEKTFDPLFVTHCPKELVPLAKQNPEDDSLVDVYELIINGQEISPGYSELNDPTTQRQRLLEQAGEETQKIDEEFLLALEHGMPPAGGIGIGIDRLTMLLTGAESIRDVILFPLLKPRNR